MLGTFLSLLHYFSETLLTHYESRFSFRMVAVALVGIRVTPLITGLIWRHVEAKKHKYTRF